MKMRGWNVAAIACVLGISFCAFASFAETDLPEPAAEGSELEACGHMGDMRAARQALQDKDRETALLHLKAARDLLRLCEESAEAVSGGRIGRDII
jgi:hypothetical protein